MVSTQFDNNGYAYPSDNTWIQIHTTRLGNMWIKVENTKIGVIRPMNADLNVKVATPCTTTRIVKPRTEPYYLLKQYMQKLNSCRHPVCMLFRLKLRGLVIGG